MKAQWGRFWSWRPHWRPAGVLAAIAVLEYLSPWQDAARPLAVLLAAILTGSFLWESARQIRRGAGLRAVLRTRFLELALTAAALALLLSKFHVWSLSYSEPTSLPALEPVYRQYTAMFIVMAGLRLLVGEFPVRRILHRLELRPAQTVAMGFAVTILVGTLLLSLPPAVSRLEAVSILDALFTATSAATVTGLGVYDIGAVHSPLGQVVLLLLIQLGGLGTMAASASLVILAGRRLRLQRAAALQESMDLTTLGHVRTQIWTILVVTLVAEGVGGLLLYLAWRPHPGVVHPGFAAIFHAVSAFCNAGFSTFSANLVPLRNDVATNLVIAALIVSGGLGFPVLHCLGQVARRRLRGEHGPGLTLHARLALLTTGVLLAAGTLAFYVLECHGVLAALPWGEQILTSGFQSVTARTAGFSTVDISLLKPATLCVLMGLMFVGGCPGSTAGGIKTTTAAVVWITVRTILRGRERTETLGRTLLPEQVAKALALVGVGGATVSVAILALLVSQPAEPVRLAFEAVSAFGTVGLSANLTPQLDPWGKFVIMGLMFIGRTGPLTLGFAIVARQRPARITYPAEKIMIG
jgi:trk system potassium uptake protein TrkH